MVQALMSRVGRQERVISQVDAHAFLCNSQGDVEAFGLLPSLVLQTGGRGEDPTAIGFQALIVCARDNPRPLTPDGSQEDVRAV